MSSQIVNESKDSDQENINSYPMNQLRIIYGDDIQKIMNTLDEMHSSSTNYFCSEISDIKNDYETFYSEINKNINMNAFKLIKYFKLEDILNGAEDEEKTNIILKINEVKLSTIKNIISTHSAIIETIKQNIKSLKAFLSICQTFEKNPIHVYYEKELSNIAKNWLLLKLNLENFNFNKTINESNLDPIFKDFIIKQCQCKNVSLVIQNPKSYFGEEKLSPEEEKKRKIRKEADIKTISENQNNIVKLKMKYINEADSYFIKSTSFTKMKRLSLENLTLKNYNILYLFPYLTRLRIKSCQSLEIDTFKNMSTNLRKLYLVKNGYVNYEFQSIVQEYLLKSKSIRDNLEVLSFANNNISKIDFTQIILNDMEIFRAMKELDFRKNKLTKFIYNKTIFPSLNFINLCENNFNKDDFEDSDDVFILKSGNMYLMDSKFREDYYNKLNKTISNDEFPSISYLNLSYIPGKISKEYFSKFKIGPSTLMNLKKLVLSYNKLSCETLFNFICNIKEPINLNNLNLNGNELDDTFFELYLNKNISQIFPKLKHISLSSNNIGDSKVDIKYKDNIEIKDKQFVKEIYKLRMMYEFIEANKNLTKINITKNPISDIYTIVPYDKKDADVKFITKDQDDKIIINGFFSFLIKIRDELLEKIMRSKGELSRFHKPCVVHRLDRDTSGVMMFALNENVQKKVMASWHTMVTERLYRALAENPLDKTKYLEPSGIIDEPLAQNAYHVGYVPRDLHVKTVEARTHYKIIEQGETHTLFELSLDTGKKNQIRAHLSFKHYPLAGDENYRSRTDPFYRLCLHARTLEFVHPVTREKMHFEIPEPEEWLSYVKNGDKNPRVPVWCQSVENYKRGKRYE